jgi:hypothetical protein
MSETVAALPPKQICDAYNAENTPAARVTRLWNDFGDLTITRMAQGAICMADIWASAWKDGNGAAMSSSLLVAQDPTLLSNTYHAATFFPSMSLELMAPILTS